MKKQLSKTDVEKLNEEINTRFGKPDFFHKKDQLLLVDTGKHQFIVRDKQPLFFYHDGKLVPNLKMLLQQNILKTVAVDMGAVKFVASGADVMRPGIKEIDPAIKKDDLVVVVDITHKKPLCVAHAQFSGEEMQKMGKGKVLKNVHYVGDEIWKFDPAA